jgi:FMN phosphatase YigB (HAD superfamily)
MFKPVSAHKGMQTIVIFDWDDTLLCTTAFRPETESDMNQIQKNYRLILSKIDELVVRFLI